MKEYTKKEAEKKFLHVFIGNELTEEFKKACIKKNIKIKFVIEKLVRAWLSGEIKLTIDGEE